MIDPERQMNLRKRARITGWMRARSLKHFNDDQIDRLFDLLVEVGWTVPLERRDGP